MNELIDKTIDYIAQYIIIVIGFGIIFVVSIKSPDIIYYIGILTGYLLCAGLFGIQRVNKKWKDKQ